MMRRHSLNGYLVSLSITESYDAKTVHSGTNACKFLCIDEPEDDVRSMEEFIVPSAPCRRKISTRRWSCATRTKLEVGQRLVL